MADENFQTNKDVVINLMDRIDNLEGSLKETNRIIVKYNGLRETLEEVEECTSSNKEKINKVITEIDTERSLLERLGKYSGWIVAILTLIGYLVEVGIIG